MLVTEILEKVWNLTDICKIGKKERTNQESWQGLSNRLAVGKTGEWRRQTKVVWEGRLKNTFVWSFQGIHTRYEAFRVTGMSLLEVDNTATEEWTQHPGICWLSWTFGQGHHSRLVDQNSNPALRAVEVMDCFPLRFSILTYSFSLRSKWQGEGWCTKDKCCFLHSVARNGFGPGRHTTGCVKREGSQPASFLPPHLFIRFSVSWMVWPDENLQMGFHESNRKARAHMPSSSKWLVCDSYSMFRLWKLWVLEVQDQLRANDAKKGWAGSQIPTSCICHLSTEIQQSLKQRGRFWHFHNKKTISH